MGSTSGTFPCPAPPAQAALGTQAGLGAAAFTTANSFILLTKHLQLNTMGKKKVPAAWKVTGWRSGQAKGPAWSTHSMQTQWWKN